MFVWWGSSNGPSHGRWSQHRLLTTTTPVTGGAISSLNCIATLLFESREIKRYVSKQAISCGVSRRSCFPFPLSWLEPIQPAGHSLPLTVYMKQSFQTNQLRGNIGDRLGLNLGPPQLHNPTSADTPVEKYAKSQL